MSFGYQVLGFGSGAAGLQSYSADLLIVAGGAGSSNEYAGGGGAGGPPGEPHQALAGRWPEYPAGRLVRGGVEALLEPRLATGGGLAVEQATVAGPVDAAHGDGGSLGSVLSVLGSRKGVLDAGLQLCAHGVVADAPDPGLTVPLDLALDVRHGRGPCWSVGTGPPVGAGHGLIADRHG